MDCDATTAVSVATTEKQPKWCCLQDCSRTTTVLEAREMDQMEIKKQTRRPLNDLSIASGSKERRRTDGEPEKERKEDERGEEKKARWGE